ncbi:MAG: hypothetical protein J5501_02865 [Ruminococcus sp.]|nr:hypothetical protein [Ruminococcus sp.]
MKVKLFSSTFLPAEEKYDKFFSFESELNEFISTVKVIDIKYSTAAGMCHDAQTHANEYFQDFSALVMYEDIEEPAPAKKPAAKKTAEKKTAAAPKTAAKKPAAKKTTTRSKKAE